MDWLTFVSSLVSSLSWPCGLAVVALIFRSEVRGLFTNLSTIRWKEFEFNFNEKVERIREELKAVESDPDYEDRPIEAGLVRLVETHPHLAVLEGWKSLERAIIDVAARRLQIDRARPFQEHLSALQNSNLLPKVMLSAISDIRSVRNQAAHEIDAPVSSSAAYLLLDTIADITAYLEKIAGKK